jgi:hypothetical protein
MSTPTMMKERVRKYQVTIAAAIAALCSTLPSPDASAQVPVDAYLNLGSATSSPAAPGTQVTAAILNNGTLGSALSWSATMGNQSTMKVGGHVSGCNLGTNISVNGVTYTPSTPSQSFAYNDNTNFSDWQARTPGGTKVSVGFCFQSGIAPSATGSLVDRLVIYSNTGHFAVFQQCPGGGGSCVDNKFWIETDGANGTTTTHSGGIVIETGVPYWVTMQADFTTGVGRAQLAVYQAQPPYSQVGATVSAPLATQNESISSLRIGNDEIFTGNDTSYFENLIVDFTHAQFPLGVGNASVSPPNAPTSLVATVL